MKILLIHYRYFISGGPERYMFNVKKALEEKGHKVIPFSIKNKNNAHTEYEDYFVENIGNSNEVFIDKYPKTLKTYIDLVAREFYSFKVKRKLEKLIKLEKPDICYLLVYKRALSPSVIFACHKYKIPVVNRISDYNTVCGCGSLYRNKEFCDLCTKSDKYCLMNKCIKNNTIYSLMRYLSIKFHHLIDVDSKIDRYICTNEFMKKMMIKYGYNPDKMLVIPTFFKETEESKKIKQKNKNIVKENTVKFLFIGNIDETKGTYDLLEAVHLLNKKDYNFKLFIVGGLHNKENDKIKEIISKYNLGDKVTLTPFMKSNEVYNYYGKCNVTVLPTRWVENLPNTLIESIYFERPVVVPNFGSFKYTVDDTVSFKFEALSKSSLYDCLESIILNPSVISEKSNNCNDWFNKNFQEENHINKLLNLFEEVKK